MDFKDYYSTLGVAKTATPKEIKQAFRKLARQHHPDVNPGDKAAEAKFKEITEAYEVLRDPDKRARYDRDTAYAILDAGFVCHLGFNGRDGLPVVIPTTYGRLGGTVYVHGSPAAGMVRSLKGGLDVSLAVTHVDGLVLAHSIPS